MSDTETKAWDLMKQFKTIGQKQTVTLQSRTLL